MTTTKQKYYARTAESITALSLRIMQNISEGIEPMSTGVFYAPYIPVTPLKNLKMPPKTKWQFSRAKWHEADLFNSGYRMDEVREWCVEHFGPRDHNPDAWSRWTNNFNSTFRFRDQKDYNWFVMRWSA